MTTAIPCPSPEGSPAPAARFGAALAASAVAHGLLLTVPAFEPHQPGASSVRDSAPLSVRLAPEPISGPDLPAIPQPEAPLAPLRTELPPGEFEVSSGARPAPGAAGSRVDALALPGLPDPNDYAAPDLDSYPRPLTALGVDRAPGVAGGEVRFEVLIDERGIVREVRIAGSIRSGGAEEELRTLLAETRFLPAMKDGRAVRSRIVLSITSGPGKQEP